MRVPHSPVHCCMFHREEIFACALIKLSHGLAHTGMSDFAADINSVMWGAAHNFAMGHLDETLINSISIDSLSMWVHHLPSCDDSIRKKCCSYREEEDDEIEEVEITYDDQGSFDVRGLMDASVFKITRFVSGPEDEGLNQQRRPNECTK